MRKPESKQNVLFSYRSIEDRITKTHPIRALKDLVDQALDRLSNDFDKLYSKTGRPSIPPEQSSEPKDHFHCLVWDKVRIITGADWSHD